MNPLGTVPVLVTEDGNKEIGIVNVRNYLMEKYGDKQIFRGKFSNCSHSCKCPSCPFIVILLFALSVYSNLHAGSCGRISSRNLKRDTTKY